MIASVTGAKDTERLREVKVQAPSGPELLPKKSGRVNKLLLMGLMDWNFGLWEWVGAMRSRLFF